MNVGPTERIGPLLAPVSAAAGGGAPAGAAVCAGGVPAAGGAVVCAGGVPAAAGARPLACPFCAGGCDNCLARSSVTTTSPGSTASSLPTASAQLWPGFLQLHAASNCWRYLNAFGSCEYG